MTDTRTEKERAQDRAGEPRIIGRSGWVHERGHFSGYCFAPDGTDRVELGYRAYGALGNERLATRRTRSGWDTAGQPALISRKPAERLARTMGLLNERVRIGTARSREAMVGKLQLLDPMTEQHEGNAIERSGR